MTSLTPEHGSLASTLTGALVFPFWLCIFQSFGKKAASCFWKAVSYFKVYKPTDAVEVVACCGGLEENGGTLEVQSEGGRSGKIFDTVSGEGSALVLRLRKRKDAEQRQHWNENPHRVWIQQENADLLQHCDFSLKAQHRRVGKYPKMSKREKNLRSTRSATMKEKLAENWMDGMSHSSILPCGQWGWKTGHVIWPLLESQEMLRSLCQGFKLCTSPVLHNRRWHHQAWDKETVKQERASSHESWAGFWRFHVSRWSVSNCFLGRARRSRDGLVESCACRRRGGPPGGTLSERGASPVRGQAWTAVWSNTRLFQRQRSNDNTFVNLDQTSCRSWQAHSESVEGWTMWVFKSIVTCGNYSKPGRKINAETLASTGIALWRPFMC